MPCVTRLYNAPYGTIGIEQRELLRSVCIGIRVVAVDDDFLWSLLKG